MDAISLLLKKHADSDDARAHSLVALENRVHKIESMPVYGPPKNSVITEIDAKAIIANFKTNGLYSLSIYADAGEYTGAFSILVKVKIVSGVASHMIGQSTSMVDQELKKINVQIISDGSSTNVYVCGTSCRINWTLIQH